MQLSGQLQAAAVLPPAPTGQRRVGPGQANNLTPFKTDII